MLNYKKEFITFVLAEDVIDINQQLGKQLCNVIMAHTLLLWDQDYLKEILVQEVPSCSREMAIQRVLNPS